jgi:hypothetical protein
LFHQCQPDSFHSAASHIVSVSVHSLESVKYHNSHAFWYSHIQFHMTGSQLPVEHPHVLPCEIYVK